VLTGADVRPARLGRRLQDWPVLCWDRVLFVGDRVAAVAADTRDIAEEAVRLIDVDYEELPAVLDMDAAVHADAPILHPDGATYRFLEGRGPRPVGPHPNHQGHVSESHGDVDAAFAGAARVFEHEFTTPRVHQAALEPHVAIVWLEGDRVHVVSTNKAPFGLRDQMAAGLGLAPDRIVVDNGIIGGDFGGKGLSTDEYVLYFLAKATGRPVRCDHPVRGRARHDESAPRLPYPAAHRCRPRRPHRRPRVAGPVRRRCVRRREADAPADGRGRRADARGLPGAGVAPRGRDRVHESGARRPHARARTAAERVRVGVASRSDRA